MGIRRNIYLFLEGKKSFNYYYINLRMYSVRPHYATRKETLYKFGRKEIALQKMYDWRNDFTLFPKELILLGCSQEDLNQWIKTLETGITKTGKPFRAAI